MDCDRWCFRVLFGTAVEAASGRPHSPKIIPKSQKNMISELLFHGLLHLLQHTFCLAGRIHSESHCNYSRLDLYLPSLGKVKMVTQYPQIAWGSCLGVRRLPAAGVFDVIIEKWSFLRTMVRYHSLRLRDHPGRMQGWESVCWGGSPYFRLFNVIWCPWIPLLSAI